MKFTYLLPLALAVNEASAFAPQQRTFVRPAVQTFMSEEEVEVTPAPPAPTPAPAPTPPPPAAKREVALVPIKEETVEFTAGILGGTAGLFIGGPVIAALGAAAANYVSKGGNEASNVVGAVSKSAIEVYNYLAGLDNKYELLLKAQASLEKALARLKSQESVDPEAIKKVEDALASTRSKIAEINDEYDIVGSSVTAFGVVGDLVEKTVKKVGELNEEYKLTDKARDALNSAVAKAKEASK